MRAQALPAFYAFIGADTPGRFARLGKAKWLQKYQTADDDMVTAFPCFVRKWRCQRMCSHR